MTYEMEEMLFLATVLSGAKPVNILKQVLTKSISPILITDKGENGRKHRIIYANKGLCHLTGYELAELVGRSPSIFRGPKSNKDALKQLQQDLVKTGYFRGHSYNYRKDGTYYPMEWDISPIMDDNGEIIYFISIIRDLTPTIEKFKETRAFNETLRKLILDMGRGELNSSDIMRQAQPIVQKLKEQAVDYSETLSEHDDLWDDPLFDDTDTSKQSANSKPAVSAEDYLSLEERLTNRELTDLLECIKDIEDEITTLAGDPSALYVMDEITNKLTHLSNTLFFLVDFTDVSLALSQVTDSLPNISQEQLSGFGIEFLQSLVVEIDNWTQSVFVSRTASNIYEGAEMIIAAANQIQSMCAKK